MKNNKLKTSTKEKIFEVSIDLFAKKGFDAVSVREIAGEVGIRESSIYNHYKSKEAILDAIIDYFMLELNSSGPPEKEMDKLIGKPEMFFEVGARTFLERMNTPKLEKIWRIISIELYHNNKIRNFYKNVLFDEPIMIWEEIFAKMMEKGVIKKVNPKIIAHEYYYFVISLFFEYFILKYDEENENFIDLVWQRLSNHAEFILEAIKV